MKACILTIGDELLIGQVVNSNASWISEQLTLIGIEVSQHLTVGDAESDIERGFKLAAESADFILVGGGLGPTHDDRTLEVLARYTGRKMIYDSEWISRVENFFKERGRLMPENNRKQGFLPENSTRIDNDCGTAAGVYLEHAGKKWFSFPGVPYEMKSMMNRFILPMLAKNQPNKIYQRTLLTTGVGESALAESLNVFVKKVESDPRLSLAFLPSPWSVRLRLMLKSGEDCTQEFEDLCNQLQKLCGENFFGINDESIESLILNQLFKKNLSLSLAESCTGGLIAHRLTQIPGASRTLKGAIVPYQTVEKEKFLKIPLLDIHKNGVVSQWTAEQMAKHVAHEFGSDCAIATTGYLGPDSGSFQTGDANAPVGTVWIAVKTPRGIFSKSFLFEKNRERSKERASQAALDLLRRSI